EGSHIWDVDGREYIDYVGSWGPLIFGHRPPEVVKALEEILQIGTSFGAATEREVQVAESMRKCFMSVAKVRLVKSGTEAMMIGTAKTSRASLSSPSPEIWGVFPLGPVIWNSCAT